MAKIAFLGLGQMGIPMATRLLEAGHTLTVWNRTPDRAKPLASRGAAVAGSPAEAGAAFAITMLATPEALNDVVLGEHGLVRGVGPGQVYIDMSTVGRTPCDRSPVVRAKRANIESGQYPPSFKLRHAAKDLRLVIEAAAAVDRGGGDNRGREAKVLDLIGICLQKYEHNHAGHGHIQPDWESDSGQAAVRLELTAECEQQRR